MLTSFSLTQLILISVTYLSTRFGIAWITERGYVPRRLVRHPLVYTLSLGVYASAWAFLHPLRHRLDHRARLRAAPAGMQSQRDADEL